MSALFEVNGQIATIASLFLGKKHVFFIGYKVEWAIETF